MPNTPEIPGGYPKTFNRDRPDPSRRRFGKLFERWQATPQQLEVYRQTREALVPLETRIRSRILFLLTNDPPEGSINFNLIRDTYTVPTKTNSGEITKIKIQAIMYPERLIFIQLKIKENTIDFDFDGQISEITLAPFDSTGKQAYIQFSNARRMFIFDSRAGYDKFPVLPNGNCHHSDTPFSVLAEKFVLNAAGEILPPRLASR